MLSRKLNAGFSLLSTFLILSHAIFLSVWMIAGGSIVKEESFMPWILMGAVIVHALISIDLAISGYSDTEEHNYKRYPKKNVPTIIQRASGCAMVPFIGLHIAGAANGFQPEILHGIIHPLFFLITLAHVSVSTGKALITLGIGNVKVIKIVDVAVKVLCAATFIAGVVGFYLYLFAEAAG